MVLLARRSTTIRMTPRPHERFPPYSGLSTIFPRVCRVAALPGQVQGSARPLGSGQPGERPLGREPAGVRVRAVILARADATVAYTDVLDGASHITALLSSLTTRSCAGSSRPAYIGKLIASA